MERRRRARPSAKRGRPEGREGAQTARKAQTEPPNDQTAKPQGRAGEMPEGKREGTSGATGARRTVGAVEGAEYADRAY